VADGARLGFVMSAFRMLHLHAKAGSFKPGSHSLTLNSVCELKERSVAFVGGLKLLRAL
jgi:hypothetical protein